MTFEKPSVEVVSAMLQLKKQLIRVMEWTDRSSVKNPQWKQFESKCYAGSSESDELIFRAHYRPAGNIVRQRAIIPIPEACHISLFIGEHRVYGIDSQLGQAHRNKKGKGLKFHGKLITSHTHIHMWTNEGEGYVEPIEPPIVELEDVIAEFCKRAILYLNGAFLHPQQGKQLLLIQ